MNENPLTCPVVIVGAGLTGITLAFYLQKRGIDFLLVERQERPGGVISTFCESGFTYEAGPNTGVLGNLEMMQLFTDLEGECRLEVANPEAKRRLIWKQGRWHSLPASLKEAIDTPLFSFNDKLRFLGEPFRPKGTNPLESVADLVKRRMGESFLDYAVDPFISGVYAGNPHELITQYALPKLFNLEQTYGSFTLGALAKKFIEKGPKPSGEVFSAKGGLENLINALVNKIGRHRIVFGAKNCQVTAIHNHFKVSALNPNQNIQINSQVVVSTVGSNNLEALLPFVDTQHLKAILNLDYAKVVQVVMGFGQWKGIGINAFGGLVPSKENRRILGVLFTSSFLSGRAPAGGALLNVFMGGSRHPGFINLSDKEILQFTREEICEMMGLNAFNPDVVRVFRYPYAIPQYGAGSAQRIEAIGQVQQRHRGLFLAGNLHSGIGMADRVAQAVSLAEKIETFFNFS